MHDLYDFRRKTPKRMGAKRIGAKKVGANVAKQEVRI